MSMSSTNLIANLHDAYGEVKIYDDGDKRYLSFAEGDQQTSVIKTAPHRLLHDYNRVMALVLMFYTSVEKKQTPLNDVLILGLGGGALVSFLHYHFPEVFIRVVELRQVVISAATQYFYLPQSEKIQIIQADALSYIDELSSEEYDVVFSDLYIPEGLEARQLTGQFLCSVKKVIKSRGFLVLNAWQEYRTPQVLCGLFKQYFAHFYECITKDGNWVVILTDNDRCSVEDLDNPRLVVEDLSRQLGFSLLPYVNVLD